MKERLQLNAVPKTARLMALLIRKTIDLGAIAIIRGKVNTSTIILNHKWRQNELRNALETVPPDFIICSYKHKSLFLEFKKPIIFIEELSTEITD